MENYKKYMILTRFLWIFPFISFFGGYLIISLISTTKTIQTPALVGQSLDKALVILSQKNLNVRVVGHKDEPELAEGTIISQTPQAETPIKEHQALYIVIARKPAPLEIPDLKHKPVDEAAALIESKLLQTKICSLPTDMPTKQCVAQYPQSGMAVTDQTIVIYTQQNQKPVIMPNVKQKSVDEVVSFLALHGITPDILHVQPTAPGHTCYHCTVTDQRPLPGSLIVFSPDKPIKVQLQVG